VEEQRAADYEAAIGPNTGYYLKYFADFDAGESTIGWHWPAFFATSGWFIYRKMWVIGILSLAWPLVSLVAAALMGAAAGQPNGLKLAALSFVVLLILPFVLLPVFANALYWRHVRRLMADLPASVSQVPEKRKARLEREGGTSAGAAAGVMAGAGFLYIFVLGVLAAIAIPAYQDFTIRAQVTEGLNLASPMKRRVEEYWAANQAWPGQTDLGTAAPIGKSVTSVEVISGSVVITYGNAANSKIVGHRIALLPGINQAGDLVWACGYFSLPKGAHPGPGPNGSDLAPKHLPSWCREGTMDTETPP
jgi:type IV pilus assembly protein PilA